MKVRPYRDGDWSAWLRMSLTLFANYPDHDLVPGMREFRARDDAEVLVAEDTDGSAVGFVEVGTRPYADGVTPLQWDTSKHGMSIHTGEVRDTAAPYLLPPKIGLASAAITRWPQTRSLEMMSVTQPTADQATKKSTASSNTGSRYDRRDGLLPD